MIAPFGDTSKRARKRAARARFWLRVDQFRVFYDISGQEGQVLAIVTKEEAEAWPSEHGSSAP